MIRFINIRVKISNVFAFKTLLLMWKSFIQVNTECISFGIFPTLEGRLLKDEEFNRIKNIFSKNQNFINVSK